MADKRDDRGRFRTGQSGNPLGRPRVVLNVRDLAREHTEAAIETLSEIMGDKAAPAAARISAASELLNRGYGRPVDQRVLMALSHQIERPLGVKDLTTKDIIDLIVQQRPAMIEG